MKRVCGFLCAVVLILHLFASAGFAAPMTADQIRNMENLFNEELQGLTVVKQQSLVSRNQYYVRLVRRLVELGYLPEQPIRNGRSKDMISVSTKAFAATDFFAQVAGLPHTWGEIAPLTFVSLVNFNTECPVPMLSPETYSPITKRYLGENALAYATIKIETVEGKGDSRVYTGTETEAGWKCIVIQQLTEVLPEMMAGDLAFVFGEVNAIDAKEKTASLTAELVAFQYE